MSANGEPSERRADDPERWREPAPIIDLTVDAIAGLNVLLNQAQRFATINGLPWRRGANAGKPLLYGGREGRGALIAYGTIGSWNEIDLAIAAVNALPALLHARVTLVEAARDAERFVRGFEDDPLQEGIPELLTSLRAAIAQSSGEQA